MMRLSEGYEEATGRLLFHPGVYRARQIGGDGAFQLGQRCTNAMRASQQQAAFEASCDISSASDARRSLC
jgi:hypothetical protein